MSEQKDLQEQLLLRAQECRKSVLVITTNGFQMRGVIVGSDRFVIALKGDGRLQMVYKHAISTIVLTEVRICPCWQRRDCTRRSAMMRESGALNRGSFRANTQLFHPFYNIRFRPHFYVQKPNMPE